MQVITKNIPQKNIELSITSLPFNSDVLLWLPHVAKGQWAFVSPAFNITEGIFPLQSFFKGGTNKGVSEGWTFLML